MQARLSPLSASLAGAFDWIVEGRVGEGTAATVWRARHRRSDVVAALKVAKGPPEIALREAALVSRAFRRWGPRLLEVGVVPPGTALLPAGTHYLAIEWVDGEPLAPLTVAPADRERLAALVAHGLGRALAELHEAGIRHGDVKPANVIVRSVRPARDRASERGCTLIDLSLAAKIGEDLEGGTARYLAPELRASRGEVGPGADLYALGLFIAEVADAGVAGAEHPLEVVRSRCSSHEAPSAALQWADALLAEAPGGRPSAAWVADRAASWLGLARDDADRAEDRAVSVKRAYLAVRAAEIDAGARVSGEVVGLPREWLGEAMGWKARLGLSTDGGDIQLMGALARARWLTSLVGAPAARWPLSLRAGSEEALAERLVSLSKERPAASWTLDEVCGRPAASSEEGSLPREDGAERIARWSAAMCAPRPHPSDLDEVEREVLEGGAPPKLALGLIEALTRGGQLGRAWATLGGMEGDLASALRGEIARRRGDVSLAREAATRAAGSSRAVARERGNATLGRLAWDAGDLDAAEQLARCTTGPRAAELHGLIALRRGLFDRGSELVTEAIAECDDTEMTARLEGTLGLLEHAQGRAAESQLAFTRATDLATRAGAVLEEATYLTGEAAAASDAGEVRRALESATRAALLWERLGRSGLAARAWLSRAATLAMVGARHAADEAAALAREHAKDVGDVRAAASARWAIVESRPPGDLRARTEATLAAEELASGDADDRMRAAALLLVWADDAIDDVRIAALDVEAHGGGPAARWEWWGARAHALLRGRAAGVLPGAVIGTLLGLLDVPAVISSRGRALDAAVRLARETGDGDSARRFELARRELANKLRRTTPSSLRAGLDGVPWARPAAHEETDVTLAPAQIAQLDAMGRALARRDRLRPLLEQIVDMMILWTGVERGLLLLRAPDGRLVPRAARNLAHRDLEGDQLALSQGIARRALETGEAVVATDAFASLGDLHASVHALKVRSVLAIPLIARGATLGVVYLDDRVRAGAFGPAELAWVRLVAGQAANALADARDHALLRRSVRRAERAQREVASMLRARDAELDATRVELTMARASEATRYRYDAIIGRSDAVRAMLTILDRVTGSDVPVLLVGESGTGKELIARALHANGPRARRAFVSENCASVPESLLESALFGHVKGAFTGASSTRSGLFDVADGGTLLLDEIGEMSLAMQAKLLRVLQEGEVRPVGGDRTHKVDVRVLGATHRDLRGW